MLKKYNSITAKLLAKKYRLKLSQIKSHRKDNKVTIKDVKNSIIKLKNKQKLKNKFGKLDYVFEHEIIIDGIPLTNELIVFLYNKIEQQYKNVIKEFKITTHNKDTILKYKIGEDYKVEIQKIQEYISILFNKKYKFNNNNFIITISKGQFKKYDLDESDIELISPEYESIQGKPDTKIKKAPWYKPWEKSEWTEYDFN